MEIDLSYNNISLLPYLLFFQTVGRSFEHSNFTNCYHVFRNVLLLSVIISTYCRAEFAHNNSVDYFSFFHISR